MPARAPSAAPARTDLAALISSTTYPPSPSHEQLEQIHREIAHRRAETHHRLVALDPNEQERLHREKKERRARLKEKERAEEAAAAAAAAAEREREKERESQKERERAVVKKEERSLSPAPSNNSATIGRGSVGPVSKKRKNRIDSDDEAQERITTSGLKVKLPHRLATPPLIGGNIDFSLPGVATRPLIPPRPGVQAPLQPGPKRQAEVDEDYSNVKTVGTQVSMPTFWSAVEPYLRQIGEDDLAMLGFKADAPEVYDIPPRGRHYTEIWDEEDGVPIGTTPRVSVPNLRNLNGSFPPILPMDLRDETLVDELRGLGHITERLVAAVVGAPETGTESIEEYEPLAGRIDVKELEEKLKKELRAVMLLGEHDDYDPSKRDDDEITCALRQSQRLLAVQVALNDARKLRLAERSKHRLAYAEYQNALEGLEKSIEAGWAKRVKKFGLKKGPSSASRPPVPDQLKKLVAVRKAWLESVGTRMKERPRGEVMGLPTGSIYEGIGDEEDEKAVEGLMDE